MKDEKFNQYIMIVTLKMHKICVYQVYTKEFTKVYQFAQKRKNANKNGISMCEFEFVSKELNTQVKTRYFLFLLEFFKFAFLFEIVAQNIYILFNLFYFAHLLVKLSIFNNLCNSRKL